MNDPCFVTGSRKAKLKLTSEHKLTGIDMKKSLEMHAEIPKNVKAAIELV